MSTHRWRSRVEIVADLRLCRYVARPPLSQERVGRAPDGGLVVRLKPSNHPKQTYKVRPATPYDLILPYRTRKLAWYIDREFVTLTHVGDKGLLEQV